MRVVSLSNPVEGTTIEGFLVGVDEKHLLFRGRDEDFLIPMTHDLGRLTQFFGARRVMWVSAMFVEQVPLSAVTTPFGKGRTVWRVDVVASPRGPHGLRGELRRMGCRLVARANMLKGKP